MKRGTGNLAKKISIAAQCVTVMYRIVEGALIGETECDCPIHSLPEVKRFFERKGFNFDADNFSISWENIPEDMKELEAFFTAEKMNVLAAKNGDWCFDKEYKRCKKQIAKSVFGTYRRKLYTEDVYSMGYYAYDLQYLDALTDKLRREGYSVVNSAGDEFLQISWSKPKRDEDFDESACLTAFDMKRRLRWKRNWSDFKSWVSIYYKIIYSAIKGFVSVDIAQSTPSIEMVKKLARHYNVTISTGFGSAIEVSWEHPPVNSDGKVVYRKLNREVETLYQAIEDIRVKRAVDADVSSLPNEINPNCWLVPEAWKPN